MVLDRTMFHYRNLAATWLDQAQRNNLLTDCSSAGTQEWEEQRERRRRRLEERRMGKKTRGRGEIMRRCEDEKERIRRKWRGVMRRRKKKRVNERK